MGLLEYLFNPIGSVVNGIVGSVTSARNVDKTNAANMELAKYQNEQNLAQWERENEYNKPVNALNRLREAGVNPALINGSTVDAGQAGTMRFGRANLQPAPGVNLGLAEAGLLMSQIKLNEAKARKENADAGNSEWQLQFNEATDGLQKAFLLLRNDNTAANRDRTLAAIRQADEALAQSDQRLSIYKNLSAEQMLTMAQARKYQVKEFQLKEYQVGEQVSIAWFNANTSRMSAESLALRNTILNEMTYEQIGLLQEQTINAMIEGDGKILDNTRTAIDNYWSSHGIKLGSGLSALPGMAVTELQGTIEQSKKQGGQFGAALGGASSARENYRKVMPTKRRK